MKTLFKIAWRNIWRNKRRTMITVASIMFALFFAIIMRGFGKGSYAKMKQNAIEAYSGYLQIQKKGYWGDKNINNSFTIDPELLSRLESKQEVKAVIPRLESFSLASSGESTKGAVIMGIDPERENEMSGIKNYLSQGEYLTGDDRAVLLAGDLASYLQMRVGDTLVLFSSGYHGATAAGLYRVKGILNLPTPEMNRTFIYMPVRMAQELFSAPGRYTSVAFDLTSMNHVEPLVRMVSEQIDSEHYAVMSWQGMNKELLQMIETDNAGGVIMIGILYMVIAFGIFGTVLMMTNERIREFSVMVSVGMQKSRLALVIIMELLMLTALGVIGGIAISLPVMVYFVYNPIQLTGDYLDVMKEFNFEPVMPMSMEVDIFIMQAIAISILSLIAMSYPTIKIMRLKVAEGLRS
jgi:ABC-type lipoprotein release transport system permease subunit